VWWGVLGWEFEWGMQKSVHAVADESNWKGMREWLGVPGLKSTPLDMFHLMIRFIINFIWVTSINFPKLSALIKISRILSFIIGFVFCWFALKNKQFQRCYIFYNQIDMINHCRKFLSRTQLSSYV